MQMAVYNDPSSHLVAVVSSFSYHTNFCPNTKPYSTVPKLSYARVVHKRAKPSRTETRAQFIKAQIEIELEFAEVEL